MLRLSYFIVDTSFLKNHFLFSSSSQTFSKFFNPILISIFVLLVYLFIYENIWINNKYLTIYFSKKLVREVIPKI